MKNMIMLAWQSFLTVFVEIIDLKREKDDYAGLAELYFSVC